MKDVIVKLAILPVLFGSVMLSGCFDNRTETDAQPEASIPVAKEIVTLATLTEGAPKLRACLERNKISLDRSSASLSSLTCSMEPVELAVVSQLSGLNELYLMDMFLEDVSELQHSRLDNLMLHNVGLREFDISAFPNLTKINLGDNQLTELDLNPAKKLRVASLEYNNLKTLALDDEAHQGLRIYGLTGQPVMELDLLFYGEPVTYH
ncbi:hypothetical protein KCN56_01825 [Photobacterium galatheae]|uniref:hypothetical protein n=1 Tax=Photobacterium galatheae TaxID=1654360 RepID=UPI00202CE178|nr:hypothetical protein [Photobacterium galatheae]MCM0147305.1 hypothetical protein [Photobacterium galatheae]